MDKIECAASAIMAASKYGYFDSEKHVMRLDWSRIWKDMLGPAYSCTLDGIPHFDAKALRDSFAAFNCEEYHDKTSLINKYRAAIMLDDLSFNFNPDDPALYERQRELALYQAFRRLERPNWQMLALAGQLDELETPEELEIDR